MSSSHIRARKIDMMPNGVINSPQLDAKLDATIGAAVTDVTETDAGGVYTAAEQSLINSTKAQLNDLLASLRAAGVIDE